MKRLEELEKMLEYFNANKLLEEVIRALDENTALDVLDYIAHVHNIHID